MKLAQSNGILDFDTSENYGDAEKWSFEYANNSSDISVKTKITWEGDSEEAVTRYELKIQDLVSTHGSERVQIILFHNWTQKNFNIIRSSNLKKKVWDQFQVNIGCTTYGPIDALAAYNSKLFHLIQIEHNCLNQSSLNGIISSSKNKHTEITVRSVLLQGLLSSPILPKVKELPYLQNKLDQYYRLCASWNLCSHEVALRYLNGIDFDFGLVIGANNPSQLQETVDSLKKGPLDQDLMNSVQALDSGQHPEIDPRNWNL
jgi:aryl-alcohol dehydrogenase-like predicted oxidoreductase